MSHPATAHSSTITLGASVRRRMVVAALIVACAIAVVLALTLPGDGDGGSQSAAPAVRSQPLPSTARFDGGPNEGTRGGAVAAPGTRFDGGPDEGTRGATR
jgi:hypothetical protein